MRNTINRFNVKSITYHRNGICGTGFYAVIFTCADAPGDWIATRFPTEGHYSVINLANPEQCWRGDYFVDQIDAAISAYKRSGETITPKAERAPTP